MTSILSQKLLNTPTTQRSTHTTVKHNARADLNSTMFELLLLSSTLSAEGSRFRVALTHEALPVRLDSKFLKQVLLDLLRLVCTDPKKPDLIQTVEVVSSRNWHAGYQVCSVELCAQTSMLRAAIDGAGVALPLAQLLAIDDQIRSYGGHLQIFADDHMGPKGIRAVLYLPICASHLTDPGKPATPRR